MHERRSAVFAFLLALAILALPISSAVAGLPAPTGRTILSVTGQIEQIKVIESYPEGVFDDTAVQGVGQWKFQPASYQGKAVRAWAKQRVRFDLS